MTATTTTRRLRRVPNDVLTLKQRLFVDAYLSTGQNGRQAYLKLHPKSKPQCADVAASRLLSLSKVKDEVAHRLKYSYGITREQIEEDLLWVRDRAKAAEDFEALDANAMNRAKLAGFLVEKRQDVTDRPHGLSDEQFDLELDKRLSGLVQSEKSEAPVVPPVSVSSNSPVELTESLLSDVQNLQ